MILTHWHLESHDFSQTKKKGQNGSAGFENNGIITATTPLLDGFFSAAKLKPVNGETRTMEGPVREQPGVEGVVEIGNDSGAVPGVASFDFNWYSYILGGGFKLFFIFTPTWGVPFLGWLRDPFKWLVVSDIFYFHPYWYLGRWSNLTSIFFSNGLKQPPTSIVSVGSLGPGPEGMQ